jgi:SAM-dependent methyltransferase
MARQVGWHVEGIELNDERATLARERSKSRIYERPLEELDLEPDSFSVVSFINVFSHLISPKQAFQKIHRILMPDGILIIATSEIGAGAKRSHLFSWGLPDHLVFNGLNTLDRYAVQQDYELIHRQRKPIMDALFSRTYFRTTGKSRLRDMIKGTILILPGALSIIRLIVVNVIQRDNPILSSVVIFRKPSLLRRRDG